MTPRAPLLDVVRGLLERTYHMRSGLAELAPFVIGDRGYRKLFDGVPIVASVETAGQRGPRMLLRDVDDELRACVYFPDELIRCLERFPPQHGVRAENVDAFGAFVEEIDHLLLVAERTRLDRPVTLFELELHANVSKHLVVERFLAGGGRRLAPPRRLWLRERLFGSGRYADDDPLVRQRYEDAARWAIRLVDALQRLDRAATRLDALRAFHAARLSSKLAFIDGLAN